MTEDVLAHGDDRDGGPGRAVGVAVTLALVGLAAVAVTRSAAERPDARPSPPPPLPTVGPSFSRPVPPGDGGWFTRYVTVRRPPPGVLRAVLLHDDVPGFLVPGDELPMAVDAVGGPDHAPALVGWCAASRTFQDASGTYVYDEYGNAADGGRSLGRYLVRRHPADPLRLDVSADVEYSRADAVGAARAPRCRRPLYYPTLPERAGTVHDTIHGHRVLRGRYVVTTETRAFCAATARAGCEAQGWEQFGAGLPPGDLAGSYTYEGSFVVRGFTGGDLRVVRLPDARLLRRERVGAANRIGLAYDVRRAGGSYVLRFNPMRHVSGRPRDDSPPGKRVAPSGRWRHLMRDASAELVTYRLRPDVEVVLGAGYTGLGKARGTARTLDRFLRRPDNRRHALWLVLDDRGHVLRVVAER